MPSPPQRPSRRGLESFASRDFRRYQLARVMVILGAEAQAVAVAWQVYSITHRALDLATRTGDRHLADGLRERIGLYEAKTPFRVN